MTLVLTVLLVVLLAALVQIIRRSRRQNVTAQARIAELETQLKYSGEAYGLMAAIVAEIPAEQRQEIEDRVIYGSPDNMDDYYTMDDDEPVVEEDEEVEVCRGPGKCDCYTCEAAYGRDLAVQIAAQTGNWSDL